MSLVVPGQSTYKQFMDLGQPGQIVDLAYAEIVSFIAAETINPGRAVEMASDGLTIQQVQQTSTTFAPVGVSIMKTMREGTGPLGLTPFSVEGPTYQAGEMVPVLMRGRIYGEWKGTTQTSAATPNVYHSSTTATDRGKFTDAGTSAGSGTEVAAGTGFRTRNSLPGTGSIIEVSVNLT